MPTEATCEPHRRLAGVELPERVEVGHGFLREMRGASQNRKRVFKL